MNVLIKFYKFIHKNWKEICNEKLPYPPFIKIVSKSVRTNPLDLHYFPSKIKKFIENTKSKQRSYEFIVSDSKFIIHTFSQNDSNVEKYFEIILRFFLLIRNLANNHQSIDAEFYLTPLKKIFSGFPITPDQINSGLTIYKSESKKRIIIFRKEELFKVWIHECLHAFHLTDWLVGTEETDCLSCVHDFYKQQKNKLRSEMPCHVLESEAYTEFITQLIYFTIRSSNEDEFLQFYKDALAYTQRHEALLLNAKSIDSFWTEKTAAFGYISLRLKLLRYPDKSLSHFQSKGILEMPININDLHKKFRIIFDEKRESEHENQLKQRSKTGFSMRLTNNEKS